jgi:hypothetical protein
LLIAKSSQAIRIHQETAEAGLEILVPAHTVMGTMTAAVFSTVEDMAEMAAAGTGVVETAAVVGMDKPKVRPQIT